MKNVLMSAVTIVMIRLPIFSVVLAIFSTESTNLVATLMSSLSIVLFLVVLFRIGCFLRTILS